MATMTLADRKQALERRLEDGWTKLFAAEREGTDVTKWEDFWQTLLREYEQVCDALVETERSA